MSNSLLEPCFDKTGRRVHPGDTLKLYHYRDRRTRRHIYMYKIVFSVSVDAHDFNPEGKFLVAVDVTDIWRKGLDEAHYCYVQHITEEFEIISCSGDASGVLWYERPKEKQESES